MAICGGAGGGTNGKPVAVATNWVGPPCWKTATLFWRLAGGIALGSVGAAPWLTLIWVPACVVVRVTPWLVTVMETPNRKLVVVEPVGLTATVRIPPRMPIEADGVLIVTSDVLLIVPPTKRIAPRATLIDSSPRRC